MLFSEFNKLDGDSAAAILQKCCGSTKWKKELCEKMPFSDGREFIKTLDFVWYHECGVNDWKEAFLFHPEIGDVNSLQEKYAATRDIAIGEQKGISGASAQTLQALVSLNKKYKEKFGFIFIVFATGKTAEEMLAILQARMNNSSEEELTIAMGEQQKITIRRLTDHIDDLEISPSQITTHILDTSSGFPAKEVAIKLMWLTNGKAETITQGITNVDGRISNLLPPGKILPPGNYKMYFEIAAYFSKTEVNTFFPFAEIAFTITSSGHYHIPLLISPFGYTTYRGS